MDVETHNDYVHLQIESTEEQIRRYIHRKKRNKTVQALTMVEVSALLQHKAYEYHIYPDNKQETLIARTIGSSRFVYNHFLELWNKEYEETGKCLTYSACSKLLPR